MPLFSGITSSLGPLVSNLIEEFVAATENMASPEQFRRWCAIAMVSVALSRRVWTCLEDDLKLYPNMYVFLVSKPGIGKSRAVEEVRKLLVRLPCGAAAPHNVVFMPDEITKERMVQHLGETFWDGRGDGAVSYFALISEFATFMPEPDAGWMQSVARIWDCPERYERQTKWHGTDVVVQPYCSILAGVQPSWFAEGFPPHAYELGLPARILFIYADEKPKREFFRHGSKRAANLERVYAGLEEITRIAGEFRWDPAAQEEWVAWAQAGYPPTPDDPLLEGYTVRRDMHTGKLAMIVAAATHPKVRVITREDLRQAQAYLFHAEIGMPMALSNAGGNVYKMREETILSFVRGAYLETKKPVAEKDVRRRLGRMVSTTLITPILSELVNQKRLGLVGESPAPNRLFKPGSE